MKLPPIHSMHYRRLDELFFREPTTEPIGSCCLAQPVPMSLVLPEQQQSENKKTTIRNNSNSNQWSKNSTSSCCSSSRKGGVTNEDTGLAPLSNHPDFCNEQPTTSIRIGRFVLHRVHASPNVYVIDNFLTAPELRYLLHMATRHERQYQRSYVDATTCTETLSNNNPNEDSKNCRNPQVKDDTETSEPVESCSSRYDKSHRTSTFVSFAPHQDAKCSAIEDKAAKLLACWSSANGAVEPLQLVRYRKGQFFGVHHDLGDYHAELGTVALPPPCAVLGARNRRRRMVTLFCYLNKVPSGGATYFPALRGTNQRQRLNSCTFKPNDNGNVDSHEDNTPPHAEEGLRIEPMPGRAVLFANIVASGQPDPRTIHAGEPVLDGVKYGLNIWICEGS